MHVRVRETPVRCFDREVFLLLLNTRGGTTLSSMLSLDSLKDGGCSMTVEIMPLWIQVGGKQAGFGEVDWTQGQSPESEICRIFLAYY